MVESYVELSIGGFVCDAVMAVWLYHPVCRFSGVWSVECGVWSVECGAETTTEFAT